MNKDVLNKYEKCIINIKIISKLNAYDRLIFGHDNFSTRPYNFLMGVIRYFSGESRKDIINGLNELYNDVEYITDNITSTITGYEIENYDKLKILSKELEQLYINDGKGLLSLLTTYQNDTSTTSKIEFLIDKFKLIVFNISQQRISRIDRINRSKSE